MVLVDTESLTASSLDGPWPNEVDLIISAMETARRDDSGGAEHRELPRQRYRVRAQLHLFSDASHTPCWTLFTRDINPRGLGFITPHRLPLGYGGWVELRDPAGKIVRISCTLFRCREVAPGWFEGGLSFNREQWNFGSDDDHAPKRKQMRLVGASD